MGDELRLRLAAEYQLGADPLNVTQFSWAGSQNAPDYVGHGAQLTAAVEGFGDSFVWNGGLSFGNTWFNTVNKQLTSNSEDVKLTQISAFGSAHFRAGWFGIGGGARLGVGFLNGQANVGAPLAYDFSEETYAVGFVQPELSLKLFFGGFTGELGYQVLFPFNGLEVEALNPGDPTTSIKMTPIHGPFVRLGWSFGL